MSLTENRAIFNAGKFLTAHLVAIVFGPFKTALNRQQSTKITIQDAVKILYHSQLRSLYPQGIHYRKPLEHLFQPTRELCFA